MAGILGASLSFVLGASALGGVTSVEFGDVSGRPGEVVGVPIHVSSDKTVFQFSIYFSFDSELVEFVGYEVDGPALDYIDPFYAFSDVREPGVGVVQSNFLNRIHI